MEDHAHQGSGSTSSEEIHKRDEVKEQRDTPLRLCNLGTMPNGSATEPNASCLFRGLSESSNTPGRGPRFRALPGPEPYHPDDEPRRDDKGASVLLFSD